MRIALCNEVLAGMALERQCEVAARLGYDGLEIAPFTLSSSPQTISTAQAGKIRATIEASGLVVAGLHWLLVKPEGR
jgi:sugar phosphate isomerase/epimerase